MESGVTMGKFISSCRVQLGVKLPMSGIKMYYNYLGMDVY